MYTLKKHTNGFEYIEVSNASASAKIALQGAHIFEFTCLGKKDMLWLSPTSSFERGVAIRGGIPICWPRFGVLDATLPAHGFSRTALFTLKKVVEIDDKTMQLTLGLKESDTSRKIWDYAFELEVIFTICENLSVEIWTKNSDTKEFMITQALHTYFSVSHIQNIHIQGLQNKPYLDTLTDETSTDTSTLCINAECDRVYQEVDQDIILEDTNHKVVIHANGSSSAVVWNPWIKKGSRMSGMQADAYKEFICIETTNAYDDFVQIKPNESHSLKVTFSSSP